MTDAHAVHLARLPDQDMEEEEEEENEEEQEIDEVFECPYMPRESRISSDRANRTARPCSFWPPTSLPTHSPRPTSRAAPSPKSDANV